MAPAPYEVQVARDGKWWMITIPGFGSVTQARRMSEIPIMAREFIAASLGIDIAAIAVRITFSLPTNPKDVRAPDAPTIQ